jgi:RimJ/RimL family protein N-acetyltransferase
VNERVMGMPLTGRRVTLERLRGRHLAALYRLTHAEPTIHEWPLYGRHFASPDQLGPYLETLSHLQFVIRQRDTGEVIGLVQGLDEDLRSKTIGIGVVLAPELWRSGWPLEALLVFVDYLFRARGFRKLYFHMLASTLDRVGSVTSWWLTPECVYRRHVLVQDRYEDVHILGLHRRDWDPHNHPLLRQLLSPPG